MSDKTISASEAKKVEKPVEKKKSSKRYFKANKYAGMKFPLNSAVNGDPTTIKYERMQVVNFKEAGYDVAVGYIATENAQVIAYCEKRGFIEEIEKPEYDKRNKR